MNRSLKTAQTLLHRILNAAPWALIAGAVVTPAYAATGIAIDDLKLPTIDALTLAILLGSITLLVIALVLKTLRRKHAQIPSSNGFKEGIGRYRLQLGRGDSD